MIYKAVSKRTTFAGSLVEDILRGGKIIETISMTTGETSEEKLLKKLIQNINIKISNCGIYIKRIVLSDTSPVTETNVIEMFIQSKKCFKLSEVSERIYCFSM